LEEVMVVPTSSEVQYIGRTKGTGSFSSQFPYQQLALITENKDFYLYDTVLLDRLFVKIIAASLGGT